MNLSFRVIQIKTQVGSNEHQTITAKVTKLWKNTQIRLHTQLLIQVEMR